jgi:hypothetical protein
MRPPSHEPLLAFFQRRVAPVIAASGDAGQLSRLHGALLAAALEVPPQALPRRQPSLSLDGNPLLYSLQLKPDGLPPAFRMLVEPGGVGVPLHEQIDRSLLALDALLEQLGWREVGAELDAVVRTLFPPDPQQVQLWWGGIWLGLALGAAGPEVRAYMNLRTGDAVSRWQRFIEALRPHADRSLEEPIRDLVRRVTPSGIPIGLAVSLSEGRLRGFRLYTVLFDVTAENICRSGGLEGAEVEAVEHLCATYTERLAPLVREGASLAFDFRIGANGLIEPVPARFKVDVSCAVLPEEVQASALRPWLAELHAAHGTPAEPVAGFLEDLHELFGGYEIDYAGLGFTRGGRQLTTYARPLGYAVQ